MIGAAVVLVNESRKRAQQSAVLNSSERLTATPPISTAALLENAVALSGVSPNPRSRIPFSRAPPGTFIRIPPYPCSELVPVLWMLPVSTPGTSASLTFQVSPLVLVTVVQPQAGDDDAATSAATATASVDRRRVKACKEPSSSDFRPSRRDAIGGTPVLPYTAGRRRIGPVVPTTRRAVAA